MTQQHSPNLGSLITDRTARGIATTVGRLVSDGGLAPGTRLPTVRALGRELGVSPTTISEAWQVLSGAGAIEPRGRLGTFVVGPLQRRGPRRYRKVGQAHGRFDLDLSTGIPDPELLPELGGPLSRVGRSNLTTSYLDNPVLPVLGEALADGWPFAPEALEVVDGAMDAVDRIASTLIRYGDRVIVEAATFPPLLDLLDQLGAEVLAVEVDAYGIVPESLTVALGKRPVALFTQPRAHNPLGVSATKDRVAELASLLGPAHLVIVEDDHAGDIAASGLSSLGAHLPETTVLIRSFSKSHGPDLRLAAVGGAGEAIEAMAQRRLLGPGWSSRLLQAVLAEMLTDDATHAAVRHARAEYSRRRLALCEALDRRGVSYTGSDGINLWIEVADERDAQVALAARSIGVAPGSPFIVNPMLSDHLRVTVGLLNDGFEDLADHLQIAAQPRHNPRSGSR